MNENFKWMAAAVAVVGLSIGAVVYLSRGDKVVPVEKPPAAVVADEPTMPEEPAIKHPLAAPEVQAPLPPLEESDEPMQLALEDLIGKEFVGRFVVTKDLVRHIVVSVDNLSTEKVAERIRPVRPAPGKFAVGGSEEAPSLDPANYERYKPLVESLLAIDMKRLVALYTRHYPLFQEAYESLGHPPQYFNDRLVEVIDHLLAVPEIRGPIALTQPGVQYEFADPGLESRSAGQKALIRMGSENAIAVKDKLRELRGELIAHQPAN
jgi:hypothetical protein